MKTFKQLTIIGLASIVVACGGGGGSDSPAPTPTPGGGTGGGSGGSGGSTDNTATLQSELAKWITDMADGYIIPAYQDLATAGETLQQASLSCSSASFNQTQLTELQAAWQQAFIKWQSIQWMKLGPVINSDNPAHFRMQFMPFDIDAVDRAVFSLLDSDQAITQEYLANLNVRAQGFPALEVLLYPTVSSESLLSADDKTRRCEVVQGISTSIANMTQEIVTAWSPSGGNYRANFVEGTGEFTGQVDVVEEVVTIYLEHLELVKDEKLLKPLGGEKPGFPQIAESPRADISLALAQANVQALIDIYTAKGGHGFDDILNDHLEQTSIANQMNEALTATQTAIDSLDGSFVEALNNDASRVTIDQVINSLRDVRTILTADFVQALELNIGFNSNDGD